jgi:DNA polymerase-1
LVLIKRKAYRKPGNKLIIADYSQIELRVAAEISEDKRMITAYLNDEDLHQLTASLVSGKSMNEVTKEERQSAKAINFGLIYAMGAEGLQKYAQNAYGVNMTLNEAKTFRERFFASYLGIGKWHQLVAMSGTKESRTIGGRRRIWEDSPPLTELLNTPVQGTSADITKLALVHLHERIAGLGGKIIGTVHDEIILEAPDDQANELAVILRKTMIQAGMVHLKKVPVDVEVKVSDNWGEKN